MLTYTTGLSYTATCTVQVFVNVFDIYNIVE